MDDPLFVVIDGCEGAGKTTLLRGLTAALEEAGIQYVVTREPGGTRTGEKLREILLSNSGEPISDIAELLMMFAARAQHVSEVIQPTLAAGKWVISDRYVDSTYAYQGGGRGMSMETIYALDKQVCRCPDPDLTILLDIPTEIGMSRVRGRGATDRIERESEAFFRRVRKAYHRRAQENPRRYALIDGSSAPDIVLDKALRAIANTMENRITTKYGATG